jgi:hypothetical protein
MPVNALVRELDSWAATGIVAEFWWRDDDLEKPTPNLDRLLHIALATRTEPLLAVVPSKATADLPDRLAGAPARVAVHGWAHVDHQSGHGKKAEFGDARPLDLLVRDAARGRERLEDLFGGALLPCFVPPWNRMAPALADALPGVGYQSLSAFGARANPEAASETDLGKIVRINTHVDAIDWRGDRRFIGADALADAVARELVRRRRDGDDGETLGLLTHHLEMTAVDWAGFETVCDVLVTHPAARMVSSSALFEKSGADE